MNSTEVSDDSQLPLELRVPVKCCESEFQQLFRRSPLLSLHARFAFETIGKIGEGGMGSVYHVIDHRLDRVAALKLLSDKNATDQARLRFLREAKITAKLDHPGIPPVYETGLTADGDLYMLMRMIRGQTLSEVIKECHEGGALERRTLVEIMIKVVEAVAYAHKQGIIHRDLKPDNIMVGEFGEVLVIDWGIAKDLNSRVETGAELILETVISKSDLAAVGVTVSGTMVGTPGYMAPEQIDGDAIDQRADVFALGVILVEALTGEPAILGDTAIELVTGTASGLARSPREIDSSLSKEIDWIVREAMALDIEERTEGAGALVVQLRAYLNEAEIPGYSYSVYERVLRAVKKRSGLIVSLSVGALLLALTGNLWLTLELEGQKRIEAEASVIKATNQLGAAEEEAKRAKDVLALFNDSRNLAERGAPRTKVTEKIAKALEMGGRTKDQLLTAASIYSTAGYLEDCQRLLEEAVKRYSPCYEGLFSLHILELKKSNRPFYMTAYLRQLILQAERRGEENEYTLFSKAVNAEAGGQFNEALKLYTKMETYTNSFSWMYCNRGILWAKRGELEKALRDYSRSIELDPQNYMAFNNRGLVWKDLGQNNKALDDYNEAIRIEPKFSLAYSNRAVLWDKKTELDKAQKDFSKAIELDSKNAIAYINRALLWRDLGDLDKALKDCSRAIEIDGTSTVAYNNRGIIWEDKRQLSKALADFEMAITINSRDAQAYFNRGRLWEQRRMPAKAMTDYNNAIDLDPKMAQAYERRGSLWSRSTHVDKFEKALADYNKALDLDERNLAAYNNRGLLWRSRGLTEKALADFSKIIELSPRYMEAYANRGLIWETKKNYKRAVDDYSMAIQLNFFDKDIYRLRARSLVKLGRIPDAIKDLETFLTAAPTHPNNPRAQRLLHELKGQK